MGGNQRIYLQEFDLYKLLQSILGKLNNQLIHSEILRKFEHKLHKNMLHVFTQINEWLPPNNSCLKLAADVTE